MKKIHLLALIALAIFSSSCSNAQSKGKKNPDPAEATSKTVYPMQLTDAEWKTRLSPDQYYILRQQGTERAFSGKYDHFYEKGTYYSAATLQAVFSSDAKFNSGTGWPSFYATINPDAVRLVVDKSDRDTRVEVVDSKSG